jgi:predicted metal-dependent hydrolase
MTATALASSRIEKLSAASLRKVVDPDLDLPGSIGDGQLLADELLFTADLPLELTAEQRRTLSREQLASITDMGLRFEAVLMAGFALEIATCEDLTDPRVTYALHEIGEETRHSRLFARLLTQFQPKAKNPLDKPILRRLQRFGMARIASRPALLCVLVLGGEEIPDLLQKLAAEHPDTDPFVREVNKYHRMEEARHLAYARTVLPEQWAKASRTERFAVRYIAPLIIGDMYNMLVHPGVYETIGLDGWKTWKAVKASPSIVARRHEAIRPIVKVLLDNGIFTPGRIPKPWRNLAGVS